MTERADAMLRDGPVINADLRAALNLIVARSFERLGDSQRALTAAMRASGPEIIYVMGSVAMRDLGRVALAAGDTTTARRSWRAYLAGRAAEPALRKADDDLRKKLEELERVKR